MNRALVVAVLVGCGSSTPPQVPDRGVMQPGKPAIEPTVDLACVARAKAGHMLDDLPAEAAGFRVTATRTGAHLHRDGRTLADAEGKQLNDTMETQFFTHQPGLVMGFTGSSESGARDSCEDVPRSSCIKVRVWGCQVGVDALATRIAAVLAPTTLGDAELGVDISLIEAPGPRCKQGAACTPQPHYSTNDAVYDPDKPRSSSNGMGSGVCTDDGDCDAMRGNDCFAWYLQGGNKFLYGLFFGRPVFCGCVEHRCHWFHQS